MVLSSCQAAPGRHRATREMLGAPGSLEEGAHACWEARRHGAHVVLQGRVWLIPVARRWAGYMAASPSLTPLSLLQLLLICRVCRETNGRSPSLHRAHACLPTPIASTHARTRAMHGSRASRLRLSSAPTATRATAPATICHSHPMSADTAVSEEVCCLTGAVRFATAEQSAAVWELGMGWDRHQPRAWSALIAPTCSYDDWGGRKLLGQTFRSAHDGH